MLCFMVYPSSLLLAFLFHLTFFGYGESSNDGNERSGLQFTSLTPANPNATSEENNGCVSYNKVERTIRISCNDIRLTDVDKEINDPHILVRNYDGEEGV